MSRSPPCVLYVEESPAADIRAMSQDLSRAMLNFLKAVAIEAGSAVDAGKIPPGHQLDEPTARGCVMTGFWWS